MNIVNSSVKSSCVYIISFHSMFCIWSLFHTLDRCCSMLLFWRIFMLLQERCVREMRLMYCLYYKSEQHNYRWEVEHDRIVCSLFHLQASTLKSAVSHPMDTTPHRTKGHRNVIGGTSDDSCLDFLSQINHYSVECA